MGAGAVPAGPLSDWAIEIERRFERELEALVAVSSPSGDVRAAEEAIAVACVTLPDAAVVERIPCSSPDHADDLLVHLRGTGTGRLLLLGHLDTVVSHAAHRAVEHLEGGAKLAGSGAVDMKGGVVLALGVLRRLAQEPERFAEVALLLVVDEEWRSAPFTHAQRFAGWEGCLCFEAGERDAEGEEAVIVTRKAAGALRVRAAGRAAHAGSAPDKGANALLALAQVAQRLAALHAPDGADRLSVVPSMIRSGEALNVVPEAGELVVDMRAAGLDGFAAVLAAVPDSIDGVTLTAEQTRAWPGMDTRAAVGDVLARAATLAGRPIVAGGRGGASDASHLAIAVPRTIDGLGPRGGGAHSPGEYLRRSSIVPRAEIALALAQTLLEPE